LIVSHDRDFLDRTVSVTLGLDGSGHIDIVAGGYADWQAKRVQRSAKKPGKIPVKIRANAENAEASKPAQHPAKPAKLSYKDQRDYEVLPARIAAIDAEMADVNKALDDPNLYQRDFAKFQTLTARLEDLATEKAAAEDRWLAVAEMVEG
jgi:ABC transport system ATP-binding/permease protein